MNSFVFSVTVNHENDKTNGKNYCKNELSLAKHVIFFAKLINKLLFLVTSQN